MLKTLVLIFFGLIGTASAASTQWGGANSNTPPFNVLTVGASSGTSYNVQSLNSVRTVVVWNSGVSQAKSLSIKGCTAADKGNEIEIVDKDGNSHTYPITITPVSGTINGTATATLDEDAGSTRFTCNGSSDWISTSNVGGMNQSASNAVNPTSRHNLGGFPGSGTNPVTDNGADNTGATNNSTIFQTVDSALEAAGGGITVLPPGAYKMDTTVFQGSKTLWMTLPGAYFPSTNAAGINGNFDGTQNSAAGKTRFGLFSVLQNAGTGVSASANEFTFDVMTTFAATASAASYEKEGFASNTIAYDPSTYGAWTGGHAVSSIARDMVSLRAANTAAPGVHGLRQWGIYSGVRTSATGSSNATNLEANLQHFSVVNFNGTIAANTLTVNSITNGAVGVGSVITGVGVAAGTKITALGTGTGQTGTYTVDLASAVGPIAMTSPEIFENQDDSMTHIGCTSSGSQPTVACIYMLGAGKLQDGIIADRGALNGNFLAIYNSPGTTQTTQFSVNKDGQIATGGVAQATETSGIDYTFRSSIDHFRNFVLVRANVANPQELAFGCTHASLYCDIQSTQSGVAHDRLNINRQGGDLLIGGNALAAGATTGFLFPPSGVAIPIGVPANAASGAACAINTNTQNINCYMGGAWWHVAFVAGAA